MRLLLGLLLWFGVPSYWLGTIANGTFDLGTGLLGAFLAVGMAVGEYTRYEQRERRTLTEKAQQNFWIKGQAPNVPLSAATTLPAGAVASTVARRNPIRTLATDAKDDGQRSTTFCPRCGTARVGSFRYCRSCQFDFDTLTP